MYYRFHILSVCLDKDNLCAQFMLRNSDYCKFDILDDRQFNDCTFNRWIRIYLGISCKSNSESI